MKQNLKLNEIVKNARGNMTQIEFVKKLNVTQAALCAYESGKRQPSIDVLIKLAFIAKMPLEELIMKKQKERRAR